MGESILFHVFKANNDHIGNIESHCKMRSSCTHCVPGSHTCSQVKGAHAAGRPHPCAATVRLWLRPKAISRPLAAGRLEGHPGPSEHKVCFSPRCHPHSRPFCLPSHFFLLHLTCEDWREETIVCYTYSFYIVCKD